MLVLIAEAYIFVTVRRPPPPAASCATHRPCNVAALARRPQGRYPMGMLFHMFGSELGNVARARPRARPPMPMRHAAASALALAPPPQMTHIRQTLAPGTRPTAPEYLWICGTRTAWMLFTFRFVLWRMMFPVKGSHWLNRRKARARTHARRPARARMSTARAAPQTAFDWYCFFASLFLARCRIPHPGSVRARVPTAPRVRAHRRRATGCTG